MEIANPDKKPRVIHIDRMKLFLQKDCLDETHLAAEPFAKRQDSPKYTTPENAQYIYNEFVLVDDETPADPANPASEGPPTNPTQCHQHCLLNRHFFIDAVLYEIGNKSNIMGTQSLTEKQQLLSSVYQSQCEIRVILTLLTLPLTSSLILLIN